MNGKQDVLSVKPDKISLRDLLTFIANGNISIPLFQRDLVWSISDKIELFDSISKGYPIGSFLFWRPEEAFETFTNVGPYPVKKPIENWYVLDGYQRISTLYGSLLNPLYFVNNYWGQSLDLEGFNIYCDLSKFEFSSIKRKKLSKDSYSVPLYQIYDTYEYLDLIERIKSEVSDIEAQKNLINNAKRLNATFIDYQIPYVDIKGGHIKSAAKIFSRINSTGVKISEDFMLSAMSYDHKNDFLLSNYISKFIEELKFKAPGFEDINRKLILDCITNATGKIHFDVDIEDLVEDYDLKNLTISSFIHIEKAILFLYQKLWVHSPKMLPYSNQLVFISEYYRINPTPSNDQLKQLEAWFWFTTYSHYFTIYSLSNQRQAYEQFIDFASGKTDDGVFKVYEEYTFVTTKFPIKTAFNGVRSKAMYLFYLKTAMEGKDFNDNDRLLELWVFKKEQKTYSNLILLPQSDYFLSNNSVTDFIENNPLEEIKKHFLTIEIVDAFLSGDYELFLRLREEEMKNKEQKFIESLNIKYPQSAD